MKQRAISRLESMLERDKEEMNEPSRLAAEADFMRVAREYFETDGAPALVLEHDKGGYEVKFIFRAHRVKNFSTLK